MKPSEYQKLAARTECIQNNSRCRMAYPGEPMPPEGGSLVPNSSDTLTPIRFNHAVIGMAGEVGEIMELTHKGQHQLKNQYLLEIGDLMWYMALGANATGIDPDTVFDYPLYPVTTQTEYQHLFLSRCLSVHVGTLASLLQKWVYYGKDYGPLEGRYIPPALQNLIIDAYRHLAGAAIRMVEYFGGDIVATMTANIEKLKVRYPDKYTDWHAADENRDRAKEEKVIKEGGD